MSLFVRLWIVATLTAFASSAAGVLAFAVISAQDRAEQEGRTALGLARMVAFTAAMDPLASTEGEAAGELLRRRADGLMAMGPLLFVTVIGADLRPIADLASPGLEEESVLRSFPELMRTVNETRLPRIEHRGAVIYVMLPLTDRAEQHRGVFGAGFPVHVLRHDDDMAAFAAAAAAIALVLGLLAAAVLTRQVAWPVRRLAELAGRLDDAGFDTSGTETLVGRGDEIGRLARVMLRLVRALDHLGRRIDGEADARAAAAPARSRMPGSPGDNHSLS